MVAQLRAKPGGDAIAVTMGDFADVPVPGTYRLIYVVFNTLFNLLTQDEQVHCFENVADHLTDDGSFIIEPFNSTSAKLVPVYGRWPEQAGVTGNAASNQTLDYSTGLFVARLC
jgi:hypothetical protein